MLKNRIIHVLLLLLITSQGLWAAHSTKLLVKSIECSSCAERITEKLKGHPQIQKVDVDLKHKTVLVSFKDEKQALSPQEIQTQLKEIGFDSEISTETSKSKLKK